MTAAIMVTSEEHLDREPSTNQGQNIQASSAGKSNLQ
jgi:hypothetical protein